MCFEFDARPPALPADLERAPIAGGAGAELLELRSADGTAFLAAFAESPAGSEPGVVILPDVRGLYPFYIELAERFATAGHHAISIDYFGRTAGLGPRSEDFDYMPHVMQTSAAGVQADLAAALATLRERTGALGGVTVGFCFGGLHSLLAATSLDRDLDAVVSFYGRLDGTRFGVEGRCSASQRSGSRCLASTAALTRASPSTRCASSTRACPSRGCRTRSRSTRARRTRSSTGSATSSRTHARTPGVAYSASSGTSARSHPSEPPAPVSSAGCAEHQRLTLRSGDPCNSCRVRDYGDARATGRA
jgi:dienelactone hydrolase